MSNDPMAAERRSPSSLNWSDDTVVFLAYYSPKRDRQGAVVWPSRSVFHVGQSSHTRTDGCGDGCAGGWHQVMVCGQIGEGCDHGGGIPYTPIRLGDLNLGRARPCLKCWPELRLP